MLDGLTPNVYPQCEEWTQKDESHRQKPIESGCADLRLLGVMKAQIRFLEMVSCSGKPRIFTMSEIVRIETSRRFAPRTAGLWKSDNFPAC